ncbi:LacI family DNA-binding transcriptional regulator [Treponema sp.]|uniref:LacI family DNA-binding transcriptional regulator n=1 Tax=Treponema sp. TaxID=166 RepID=UPI0025EE81F2|nr:LacI family DNA-binding transcriptional regulator [Treponema sp.]MCR5218922.1 LacI family transcriptional regulator [Treponema sp.]
MAGRTVTQDDVAKEAGVTRSMVSYVISGNQSRAVAPETRQRILDAIEKLDYRPNKAAQVLKQGDVAFASKSIGVILCNADVFRRPYYAEIIAGIHAQAHKNKYSIRFIRFFNELKDPVLFNKLISQEEIGALILVAIDQAIKTEDDRLIIEKIRERIDKTVCVEWKYDGLSSVLFDRQEAAKKAAMHLVNKGYKNFVYIGENDERVSGVGLVAHELGLGEDFYAGEAFNMDGGYDCIKKLHKEGLLPRAVVCGSDEVAIGVLCYLNEKKIDVPSKLALISIDNIEFSGYTYPPLTTMNVQKHLMGERAVELIVKDNAGQNENAFVITLPVNIVERKSC